MESASGGPIRVLIADGDPLVCRALVRLLQDVVDLDIVATASTGERVLELANQLQPAIAVVDARTARMDGLAVTRNLAGQVPATRVVVVSVYAMLAEAALAAGACRFLLKDGSREELVTAIRLAALGQCQVEGAGRPAAAGPPAGDEGVAHWA